MKKLILFLLLSITLLGSCKKDVPPEGVSLTVDEMARDFLYDQMNQIYLWYDKMPSVVKNDYKDPYELLEAMRYKALDRWSFVQTYEEYQAMFSGNFVGHGISMGLDSITQTVRIVQIYNRSPLYSKGVRRGWIVKKLNGTSITPIFIARDNAAYIALIGEPKAGITNTFVFQTPSGKDTTIVSTKTSFILNTVIIADTLHLKSGITGHLVFDQFIPLSTEELRTAFAFFRQNNIKDLILDLRYNGGGDLDVLTDMASYLAGSSKFNTPFLKLTFNDKNTSKNQYYTFTSVSYPLNLSKIIVITTRETASASEDLINGLKPHLDIKTIGKTTNGKPVGMESRRYRNNYMFWPISFTLVNSLNQGDFYSGFAPEKFVDDDFTHDWIDRNESCLKEAIYYLEHGNVSSKGQAVKQASSIKFNELPLRNNNAYMINK